MAAPRQGEIWLVDLNPVRGHEQAGRRPAVVVSVDKFNHGLSGLAIVVPITGTDRGQPLHVRVDPPEGGLRKTSFAKPEDVRSISQERLVERWGATSRATLQAIVKRIQVLTWT